MISTATLTHSFVCGLSHSHWRLRGQHTKEVNKEIIANSLGARTGPCGSYSCLGKIFFYLSLPGVPVRNKSVPGFNDLGSLTCIISFSLYQGYSSSGPGPSGKIHVLLAFHYIRDIVIADRVRLKKK